MSGQMTQLELNSREPLQLLSEEGVYIAPGDPPLDAAGLLRAFCLMMRLAER